MGKSSVLAALTHAGIVLLQALYNGCGILRCIGNNLSELKLLLVTQV